MLLYQFELIKEENLPKIYADDYRIVQTIETILIAARFENSAYIKLSISQENDFIKFSLSSEKVFVGENSNGFYLSNNLFGETIISYIVEQHNGEIIVESNHETGSTFSFKIPIAKN